MTKLIRSLPLLAAIFAALASAAAPNAAFAQDVRHVIIIGVDGLSPDGVLKAKAPTMQDMMANGSWSMHARGVMPTSSAANWASIINGVGPEQHGVNNNDWRVGAASIPTSVTGSGGFFPSIFQLLTDQHPEWEVGSIYHWEGFSNLYDRRFVDYDIHGQDEDETVSLAIDYIKAKRPRFLFVHLDNVDHAGHADGHGTQSYYDAVAKADALIGQMRQALIEAGMMDDSVILVTSDHGGVGKGHGGETLAELEIPWIAYGKTINHGELDLPINTFDTPATATWLLGLKTPYAWLGRPVKPILNGETAPEQTYRSSSFYTAPVIEPAGDGNAPSGGLFVNRRAQMSLHNPNAVGELRYTLDGSIPTTASTLYTRPIDIERTTIVRSALFVDGQAASVPALGLFRILDRAAAETHGLTYTVYLLPDGPVRLPDFSRLQPAGSGKSYEFSIDNLNVPRGDNIAVAFEGFIHIPVDGAYNFSLASDDGSKLYIDGKTVVDNDGDHGVVTASGGIELTSGKHSIRVEWYNGGGGSWLGAYLEGPSLPRQFIDPNLLTPH